MLHDLMAIIISVAVPAIATIAVAIIEAKANKDRRTVIEHTKEVERRAEMRKKESLISIKMMNAAVQLAIVSANALLNHHNNGNVERAYEAAAHAQQEYTELLQTIASEEVKG